ncbi:MAG: transcriptional regulator [Actinomycetota bacterium]
MTDQNELRVIHALRLKGFADTPVIAEAAEVEEGVAEQVLEGLAGAEQARYREGRMTGWMLMPDGRAHGEALLAADLDAAGKRADLDALYRRFLEHNQPFLGLCTEWQTRMVDGEQVVNDHSDADYDATVIGRLADTDAAMQPICTDLGALLSRFNSYAPRFADALAKVQAGDIEWFTKPVIESYHTVWFELHEDLLASLGIERSKEGHT